MKSNVQLVPPKMNRKVESKSVGILKQDGVEDIVNSPHQEWKVVARRGGGEGGQRRRVDPASPPSSSSRPRKQSGSIPKISKGNNPGGSKPNIRRPPKSAAVMITGQAENYSYAAASKKARDAISLKDLQIEKTKIRKAANGSLLIEVLSPNGAEKAMELRDKLHKVLENEARVTRPVIKGELRLIGLHDASSPDEVMDVIFKYGNCIKEDIKTGPIRPMRNGLHTVWVQCPLNAAIKIANHKKISVCWTQMGVELLNNRSVQCFKCWKFGHLRHACPSKEDFGGSCFRCGGVGHAARNCSASPACMACKFNGRIFNHRLSSNLCPAAHVSARIRPAPSTVSSTALVGAPGPSKEDEDTNSNGRPSVAGEHQ